MPKALERKLKARARSLLRHGKLHGVNKNSSSKAKKRAVDRYVYGTLRKLGWSR